MNKKDIFKLTVKNFLRKLNINFIGELKPSNTLPEYISLDSDSFQMTAHIGCLSPANILCKGRPK